MTESLLGSHIGISAEAEYFVKFSISTQLKTTDTTRESIRTTIGEVLHSGTESTQMIDSEEVAVFLSNVTIMMDSREPLGVSERSSQLGITEARLFQRDAGQI
jgi:hypothetical protein